MRSRVLRIVSMMVLCLVLAVPFACADQTVTTSVVMRVSRMTQNAVVNAGEDLSMEISIDGVTPASYEWYFNDAPIAGANQKVYSILNASEEDTGVYRLDAFDEDGKMLVSMDIATRVIVDEVPKSGDASLPLNVVWMAMGVAAMLLIVSRRRAAA